MGRTNWYHQLALPIRPGRSLSRLALAAVACASALGVSSAGCRGPTEMTLVLHTDVPCDQLQGVAITVGRGADVETSPPATTTTLCGPDDRGFAIGTFVLVPSGAPSAPIRIKVTAGHSRDVATCLASGDAGVVDPKGCVVARRRLGFIAHVPLRLNIELSRACDGVTCDPTSTCVSGACRDAFVDPIACEGVGCGAPGGPVLDAGGSVEDAAVEEAGTDEGCGNTAGLQAGAPWPMAGRCPTRVGRSPYRGSSNDGGIAWTFTDDSADMNVGPVIGADGTIYVGTNNQAVYAVWPDGGLRWTSRVDGNVNSSIGAIAADGTVYVAATNSGLVAIPPAAPATATVVLSANGVVDKFIGAPAIAGDGTVLMGSAGGALYTFVPSTRKVMVAQNSVRPFGAPAIAKDGTVFVTGESTVHAYRGTPLKLLSTNVPVAPDVGCSDPMIARDGSVVVACGAQVIGLDPTLATHRFALQLPGVYWMAPTYAPVESIDGTIYVALTNNQIAKLDPSRQSVTVFATLPAGPSYGMNIALDADGTVFAPSSDGTLRAYTRHGTLKWAVPTGRATSPVTAPAIGRDGRVYFTANATLFAIGP